MKQRNRGKWREKERGRKVQLFYSCVLQKFVRRAIFGQIFLFVFALPFRVPNSNYIILYGIIFRFVFFSPLLLLFNLFQLLFAYLYARHYFYSTMRRLQHTVSFSVFSRLSLACVFVCEGASVFVSSFSVHIIIHCFARYVIRFGDWMRGIGGWILVRFQRRFQAVWTKQNPRRMYLFSCSVVLFLRSLVGCCLFHFIWCVDDGCCSAAGDLRKLPPNNHLKITRISN